MMPPTPSLVNNRVPHQEHEEEDDGSQYLALEQGEQEVGDDNAGEVLK